MNDGSECKVERTWDPEKDHDEGNGVETGVEAKGTDGAGLGQQEWEADTQDGSPEQAGRDSETHADLTMRQREDLGRVSEGHGTLTGRVEGGEEIDEQGDQAGTSAVLLVDEGAETGGQQGPGHLGEGEEEEGAAAEGVDGLEGGEGEQEVDSTEDEREGQGLVLGCAGVLKHGGGVECNDVDTAHLLGDHDGEGGEGRTPHTGDGEQLEEADDICGLGDDVSLKLESGVDVVQVAGNLNFVVSQPDQRLPCVDVAALLDEPTGRLRAQVDQAQQWHSRDERSSKHVAPLVPHVVDGQVDDGSEENAKGRPQLPGHDQRTTDGSRRVLGGVHRNRRCLDSHADTHQQTASQLLGPLVAEGRSNDGPQTEVCRNKDDTTTT